ncbi:MAG: choline dehydrogenase, partial [Hyphomonadaceae bacterium]
MSEIEDGANFDYVIVGAGSAGCVLAARLSADPGVRVALLEAGGSDKSLMVRMPGGVGGLISRKGPFNWGFWTAPQTHLGGRTLWQPRGRGWGGSSAINGMIYTRGHARDYDDWRAAGLVGWGYSDLLPYFKRSEHFAGGADAWRGEGGPLWVCQPEEPGLLAKAFVQAGLAAGYPSTPDFNGAQQEGVGFFDLTIKNGERWSAAAAYLRPILGKRSNLTVISHARVTRVLFEKRAAIGVEYLAGRSAKKAFAAAEVLLCAGALQTPHVLQLSGVGPGDHLKVHGLPVVLDAPGVGANLQDHLDVSIIYESTKPVSLYSETKGFKRTAAGLDYLLRKQGPGRTNHLHAGAFLKTRGEVDRPDVQLHFVSTIMIDHGKIAADRDGFTVHACQLRPQSRGAVRLANSDPLRDPLIDPNYLESELDLRALRDAVRMVRDIVGRAPLDVYRGPEMRPGAAIVSDRDIDAWIKQTAETIYHPVG